MRGVSVVSESIRYDVTREYDRGQYRGIVCYRLSATRGKRSSLRKLATGLNMMWFSHAV